MKMSVLAWKDVAWFAAGIIAGAALGQLRRRAERPRAVDDGTLPGAGPGHRRIEAGRQEPMPVNLTATPELAKPITETAASSKASSGLEGLTKKQLYHEARKRNIRGRSTMTKAELQRALR